ncbi:FAD-binding oxidoreductase [Massilia endophytica]|uniref:FAD-binding oxidoreductase n=1 Tax=Massilia endophytica TaxID=2899220 RepID=UPI001E2F0BC3|nr:FAD-binding oxidoreductase [Massilia endophytica]UGQ45493.1 FAD-binding oxidoreductase [Massilia endophytica]
MTRISGWGRYPWAEARIQHPATNGDAARLLAQSAQPLIARGMGRSYGDSALADEVLGSERRQLLLDFDRGAGILRCQGGVTLADLLGFLVPQGWFLPVTPGTKFVTVAGAIASDVHGKNHHGEGCFSAFVDEIELLLGDGRVLRCSPQEHAPLFHATCGGMGLTGIILSAQLRLKRIASAWIEQTTLKAGSLAEVAALMEEHRGAPYSVAWIDCLSTGRAMGRSLLMLGRHAEEGSLEAGRPARLAVPVDAPQLLLNRHAIRAFNALYYHRVRRVWQVERVHYEPYFYPLDGIRGWNRLYGKPGFVQYQMVVPRAAGVQGLGAILERIGASQRGSFLAVLKLLGPENGNHLSFPLEGYTLALDFKVSPGLFELLEELDAMVLALGGRLYLAKDSRMSAATFRAGYPRLDAFRGVLREYGAAGRFASHQSRRLDI